MRFGLYLVLIITKNDSKRPDFSRSQLALFCEIQAFIRHRQNLQKVKTSFQFPYGSLLEELGNSEISRFPSFLFARFLFWSSFGLYFRKMVFTGVLIGSAPLFFLLSKLSASAMALLVLACASWNI